MSLARDFFPLHGLSLLCALGTACSYTIPTVAKAAWTVAPRTANTPASPGPSGNEASSAGENGEPLERAKDLFYRGSARYAAADYAAAIDLFTEALAIVTKLGAEPRVRGALLINLARAHARAHEVDGDIRHLRAAREIYRRYLREADQLGYPATERAETERALEAVESSIAEADAAAKTTAAASTPPAPATSDTPRDTVAHKHRVTGFSLIGVGAALAAASIGPFVYGGAVIPANLDKEIEKKMPTPAQEADFRRQERNKQIGLYVAGGLMVATGIGLVAGGAVLVRRTSAGRKAALRVTPAMGPHQAGLWVTGRF